MYSLILTVLQIGVFMCAEFTTSAMGQSYEVERLHGSLFYSCREEDAIAVAKLHPAHGR